VEKHGQVHFQPFNQEGLRVNSLHLSIDPGANFRMQPRRFIRNDTSVPLKTMIDQYVSDGVLVPDILCSHSLVIVHEKED